MCEVNVNARICLAVGIDAAQGQKKTVKYFENHELTGEKESNKKSMLADIQSVLDWKMEDNDEGVDVTYGNNVEVEALHFSSFTLRSCSGWNEKVTWIQLLVPDSTLRDKNLRSQTSCNHGRMVRASWEESRKQKERKIKMQQGEKNWKLVRHSVSALFFQFFVCVPESRNERIGMLQVAGFCCAKQIFHSTLRTKK